MNYTFCRIGGIMILDNLSKVATMQPSTSWAYYADKLVQIDGLEYNRAKTMDECIKALERSSLPTFPDSSRNLKKF